MQLENNYALASDGTKLGLFEVVHIPTGIKVHHCKHYYGAIEFDRYFYYNPYGEQIHVPKEQIHWIGESDYGKQF